MSIHSLLAIMKSLIQQSCYMQQMHHHKDTNVYSSLQMILTHCPRNFLLSWDWCREIMNIIWSRQKVKVNFIIFAIPCLLPKHVLFQHFMPWQGVTKHPFLLAQESNLPIKKWKTRPDLTTTLCHLMERSLTLSSEDIKVIQSFVASLYSVNCTLTEVNSACQQIFAQLSRTFEYLPPTKAVLTEHGKRATYQAGYVWGKSLITEKVLPSPSKWGWAESESCWVPFWTPLPWTATSLEVLVRCGYTKHCAGKCPCKKKGLVCTARCKCGGQFYRQSGCIQTPTAK